MVSAARLQWVDGQVKLKTIKLIFVTSSL